MSRFGLGFLGGGAEPFDIEYVGNVQFASFSSPYTVSDQNVGGPGLIVLHISNANTGTISGVTMDGNAMSLAVSATGTSTRTSLYYARKASGSTATFVISGSSIARMGLEIMRIKGLLSSDTPHHTHGPSGGGNSSRSVTINAPQGGGVVVGATGDEDATHTYTNATRIDLLQNTFDSCSCGRYLTTGGNETGRSITVNNCRCVCAASWK